VTTASDDDRQQSSRLGSRATLIGLPASQLNRSPMAEVGAKLRAIRQQRQLSLREVAQRSRRIAKERGDPSYRVSVSWLARIERGEHELTLNKLIALAQIYDVSIGRLVGFIYSENEPPLIHDQFSSTNETFPDQSPDETTLLQTENAMSRTPYVRGIIGKLDLTLQPMVPAGSIVQIDTGKREISPKEEWTHEFQRPIYLLKTKDGYFCGWCELDKDSQWLTLIPHSLSSASRRRWKYGTEVENLGRVVSVVIRLGE
jgi:transcriptional regulator with XRE-family HTH domain